MQGLDIGSAHQNPNSPYAMDMDVGDVDGTDLNFDHLETMPSPPIDNNQVAAWYDTDL